jgi:hypothetical protein
MQGYPAASCLVKTRFPLNITFTLRLEKDLVPRDDTSISGYMVGSHIILYHNPESGRTGPAP